MITTAQGVRYLYGGTRGWTTETWQPINDTVRGGSSASALILPPSTSTTSASTTTAPALFRGNLNTTTLGGAGFASVRATPSPALDLSPYTTLLLSISHSDGKKYVLILKDTLDPPHLLPSSMNQLIPGTEPSTEDASQANENRGESKTGTGEGQGRERRERPDGQQDKSTPSYEATFTPRKEGGEIRLRWSDFKRVYRGREQHGHGHELKREGVVGVGLMMRSFFGEQEGDFELGIRSIGVLVEEEEDLDEGTAVPCRDDSEARGSTEEDVLEKGTSSQKAPERQGWLNWLLSGCVKL